MNEAGLISKTTEARHLNKISDRQAADAPLPIEELLQYRKDINESFAKRKGHCTCFPQKTLDDLDIIGRQPLRRKKSNDSEDNLLFPNNCLLNQLPMNIFRRNKL
ncbi:hypothetical protein E3N88_40293 [Mikania micrantha]|uniref:Uncharacterized protein n=1 Tax=Mikania micrantha TaxID=192012 RepID=A0A5N6LM95_9ASTR|nr:hypothetical protein E3N88_40293 [Mikania micrantha]